MITSVKQFVIIIIVARAAIVASIALHFAVIVTDAQIPATKAIEHARAITVAMDRSAVSILFSAPTFICAAIFLRSATMLTCKIEAKERGAMVIPVPF